MHDYWPASGYRLLTQTARGWLQPSDAWLRLLLAWPEMALVAESCPAEAALHNALMDQPSRPVARAELAAFADDDARANYAMFLAFRDALLEAGSLEAYYLQLMRSGYVGIPPQFVDHIVQAIVRHVLGDDADAFEARAAEMLFRQQRISLTDGRMLAADMATVDMLSATGGLGDLGRLLVESRAPMEPVTMVVLGADNAMQYLGRTDRHDFVLDLSLDVTNDLGHGLSITLSRTHSGLKALARVLERWVAHLLGPRVCITPVQKIEDPAWRWHVGLDVESMALLNDLYQELPIDADRTRRLISLFRLDFEHPGEMRADLAGRPVYLGLAMKPDGSLRLKPQNLLLNLPLAGAN